MTDDEIVAALRASGSVSAVELAELLDDLTNGGLSQGSIITYFKRAFPGIPLRVLLDAGGWERISGGGLSDAGFNDLLSEWFEDESGRPEM